MWGSGTGFFLWIMQKKILNNYSVEDLWTTASVDAYCYKQANLHGPTTTWNYNNEFMLQEQSNEEKT